MSAKNCCFCGERLGEGSVDDICADCLEAGADCKDCQDATGGRCRRHWEPECTCYEMTGGHQPGCPMNRQIVARRW